MEARIDETDKLREEPGIRGPRPLVNGLHSTGASGVSDIVEKFQKDPTELVREGLVFIKQYPIHSAIGAAAIGFAAGLLIRRRRK